jgi:hypothetical protein
MWKTLVLIIDEFTIDGLVTFLASKGFINFNRDNDTKIQNFISRVGLVLEKERNNGLHFLRSRR